MADYIPPAKSALDLLDAATRQGPDVVRAAYIAAAQVHATLALVEQHRIANLVALSQWELPEGLIRSAAEERILLRDLADSLLTEGAPDA